MPDKIIISELSVISPRVAAIPVCTPYAVPDHYFETLSDIIHDRIAAETLLDHFPALRLGGQHTKTYFIPDGYFSSLPSIILNRIKVSEDLTASEEVESLSPLLAGLSKKTPFSLPAGYFETLMPAVTSGNMEELEPATSPLLQSLRNSNPYRVPAGYFDSFAEDVVKQVQPAGKARVIPFGFGRNISRYAVAASIAALVAVSAWIYQHPSAVNITPGALADIKNISNRELQDFIDKNTFILPESNATPLDDIKPEDVKTMLTGVTDEELQKFLEQQPNLKDPAVDYFN